MRKTEVTETYNYSRDDSPRPNLPISTPNPPDMNADDVTNICTVEPHKQTGPRKQKTKSERRYLGVRVRMPVRDMLRNIRIAKGIDPKDLLGKQTKASKGDKKRVSTGGSRRNCLKKQQTKGLEELAFIVEVLEEDLKACQTYSVSNKSLSAPYCSEYRKKFWGEEESQQGFMTINTQENEPLSPSYSLPSESSPAHSVYNSPSPSYSQDTDVYLGNQEDYSSHESDDYRYNDQYGVTYSPANSCEYQVPSPQESFNLCLSPECREVSPQKINYPSWPYTQQQEDWGSTAFFWSQMEREESLLKEISDQELLTADKNGRILLHRAVEEGKRALVCVIAKRMTALKKLDVNDSEGKTPLHLAAERNQHFIVADLVSLGANINQKDRNGKTCLHLSAENGYIRVLEVLKGFMRNGIYINLEEKDANGLSALQCAAVALNHTVRELELCEYAGQVRLHTLRKEQMMETLECLLQMECWLHALDQGRLNEMKQGVEPKSCEQAAFFQSNEVKAISIT